jgi:hypothetical protein
MAGDGLQRRAMEERGLLFPDIPSGTGVPLHCAPGQSGGSIDARRIDGYSAAPGAAITSSAATATRKVGL